MSIKITTDYYSKDNTLCITLIKDNGDFDLFWIDNPVNPILIKMYAKRIETSVNSMTDEFIDSITMIRTGGEDYRLDIAYELCDFLARNQKLLESLIYH